MMNELQTYMVHEYVADYKAGHLSRRDLLRRVLNITGGLSSTANLLLALGRSAPTSAPSPAATGKPATRVVVSTGPSPSVGCRSAAELRSAPAHPPRDT